MTVRDMRLFLKDELRLRVDFSRSDQNRGIVPPPEQKPHGPDQERIILPKEPDKAFLGRIDLAQALASRRSQRVWREGGLDLSELGFLLWATQGVRRNLGPGRVYRTVPSAGCRHALETYLLVNDCLSLEQGVYRYLPLDHALVLEHPAQPDFIQRQNEAVLMQSFVGASPVVFVWTTIPYRMEWRYLETAHRVIALDAGHVCQNLYLAVQAVGCGTCAVGAFHQQALDELLGVDGEDEFALYLAPVGKVR